MLDQIRGLHHVTALAANAGRNNAFYTGTLGLRRVKKTVNFDAPDVYHLYYGNGEGVPGTVMTYFPFPHAKRGTAGTGEASVTQFAVPDGALDAWERRLGDLGVADIARETRFGEPSLGFRGPDGEALSLVERPKDGRSPWTGGGVGGDIAIRGFRGVSLCLNDGEATADLLNFMGYRETGKEGAVRRFTLAAGNDADIVDIEVRPDLPQARQGAGSVHHVAFAVADRAAEEAVRQGLREAGHAATPVIDRNYFWSVYFRTPGGVLFEIATSEPGFANDEAPEHLGEALKLPAQHEHLRARLEASLEPIGG